MSTETAGQTLAALFNNTEFSPRKRTFNTKTRIIAVTTSVLLNDKGTTTRDSLQTSKHPDKKVIQRETPKHRGSFITSHAHAHSFVTLFGPAFAYSGL